MKVFYPGIEGSYAHNVCALKYSNSDAISCPSPEAAIQQFSQSSSDDILIIPIENSIGGKVADIHEMLPLLGDFFIFGEHYLNINHCLLGVEGASIDTLSEVHSHIQALKQCSRLLQIHNLSGVEAANTAVASRDVAQRNDPSIGVVASKEAAEFFGLKVIYEGIQNGSDPNYTRFLGIRHGQGTPPTFKDSDHYLTCFYYSTKNISAALFKSLLGFASNQVNVVKLESFLMRPNAQSASFYIEIEGHPEEERVRHSVEELRHYCTEVKQMGLFVRHLGK